MPSPAAVFAARGNATAVRTLNPLSCRQIGVNTQRGGFIVNADGSTEEVSGRYLNLDLRVTKLFNVGSSVRARVYTDPYDMFNAKNLYVGSNSRPGLSNATAAGIFMEPSSLSGPGFGRPGAAGAPVSGASSLATSR